MAIALVRARSFDLKTATAVAAGFADPPEDRRFFNQIPLQAQRGRGVQNARPRHDEKNLSAKHRRRGKTTAELAATERPERCMTSTAR